RVLADNLRGLGHGLLRFGPEVGLIVVEVDILHRLGEQFLIGWRRRRRRWWRWGRSGDRHHGGQHPRVRPRPHALSGEGRYGLRSARVIVVAVQGDVGCVFGTPGQRSGLVALNRCGVCRQGGGYGFRRRWRWWWRRFLPSAPDNQRQQG